jgi:hypothetical protein
MVGILPDDPAAYPPARDTIHAGKVFVVPQSVLKAAGVMSSDGSDASVLGDRFLLCLWDVDDGTSIWLPVQSFGDFAIPHSAKLLLAGTDPNWMDEARPSKYRDGTLWRLGLPRRPFMFSQQQQRAVTKDELDVIRTRISLGSVQVLIAASGPGDGD